MLWVCQGSGKEALKGFWRRLRHTHIETAAACGMSGAHWSAINEHLPDSARVFDHRRVP